MNDKLIEKSLSDAFLKILEKHNNPRWSTNELEYLVFVKYKNDFDKLDEESKWVIRNYISALRKIYEEKQEGDL